MQLTLVPSQQLGTTSHIQVLRRWLSIQPTISSRRRYGPLAALLRVPSGQRPSWSELMIATRLYGGVSMKSSRQSECSLLRKITPPVKWERWQSELTNCFKSKEPLTQRFTQGNKRPKSMAGKNPCAITKTIPCTFLSIVWKRYNPSHGWPSRATCGQCS